MSEVKSRKIRVLRIIARMNIGGPAIQVTTLMNHIPETQVQQLLVTGTCEAGEADYLEFNSIELERKVVKGLGRSINLPGDFKALLEIRRVMKSFKPDIVHTHTFKAGILGRLAALSFLERPFLVHTFHGHLLHGYLGFAKLSILKTIERFLAHRTDVLVSVGEKVKVELVEVGIGDGKKFEVVPPGFPMPKLGSTQKIAKPLNPNVLTCAWIGRIVEVKAPERVLEIARYISKSKSNVQFLIAGDGPLRDQIQTQSESESLPIKFLGWIGDVATLSHEVDLLILTSLNEGAPVSIIEAQRMGKPVITTDVGSVREIISVGKSGYVLDYNPIHFAELIESFAIDRTKLETFSKEAIRFAGKKFAPERLAQDYLRIYRSLISN